MSQWSQQDDEQRRQDTDAFHGQKYRELQAQEIKTVMARKGITVLSPGIDRFRCERCGQEFAAKIKLRPGLAPDAKIVPHSGELPFEGWQCPSGCSDR